LFGIAPHFYGIGDASLTADAASTTMVITSVYPGVENETFVHNSVAIVVGQVAGFLDGFGAIALGTSFADTD